MPTRDTLRPDLRLPRQVRLHRPFHRAPAQPPPYQIQKSIPSYEPLQFQKQFVGHPCRVIGLHQHNPHLVGNVPEDVDTPGIPGGVAVSFMLVPDLHPVSGGDEDESIRIERDGPPKEDSPSPRSASLRLSGLREPFQGASPSTFRSMVRSAFETAWRDMRKRSAIRIFGRPLLRSLQNSNCRSL